MVKPKLGNQAEDYSLWYAHYEELVKQLTWMGEAFYQLNTQTLGWAMRIEELLEEIERLRKQLEEYQ